jgi:MoaA/NifB/PqqE/SkfB family radical SAM enzyme
LDEVLFSVHGADGASHDSLTATPGSYKRILEAMTLAEELDIAVRTNTVVNRINVTELHRVGELVAGFKPVQVNFITINDWCYAKNIIGNLMVSYTEMAQYLKQACDYLEPLVPAVNVRYIPFCFMQGYERFVCDHRQVPYDPFEWVPRVRCRLEEQNGFLHYLAILGYGLIVGGAWRKLFKQPFVSTMDESITEGLRTRFYLKGRKCGNCRYIELCDGVERTYSAEYGFDELIPVMGTKFDEPAHFRKALRRS